MLANPRIRMGTAGRLIAIVGYMFVLPKWQGSNAAPPREADRNARASVPRAGMPESCSSLLAGHGALVIFAARSIHIVRLPAVSAEQSSCIAAQRPEILSLEGALCRCVEIDVGQAGFARWPRKRQLRCLS